MKAIMLSEFGDENVMTLAEVPDLPAPEGDSVRIKVAAAGVNRADLLQRQGHYPPPAGESDVLGLEVSGTIDALGPDVVGWRVGDEVCALLAGGGYAEYVNVRVGQVLPVPRGVDLVTAAALPEVTATVWSNVVFTADLQPGDLIIYYPDAHHVGMYVGDGKVVHASTFGVPVQVVPIDAAGPYNSAVRY